MPPAESIRLNALDRPIDCTTHPPGSKSLTNRALLVAALAEGSSTLDGVLEADDTLLMVDALRSLGIDIEIRPGHRAVVRGCRGFWPVDEADLYAGHAGTVLRFLTAACCIGFGRYRLDGSARMRRRPMSDLVNALRDLGARIGYEAEDGYCPLTVRAVGLRGGRVVFDRPISSQFISALLMAAPRAVQDVMIRLEGPIPSTPFIRMTTCVMAAFGAEVVDDAERSLIVPAMQRYIATEYAIEPDATAASYFFAAAAVSGGRVTVEGLGQASCQGDLNFVRLLERMGCLVEEAKHRTTVVGPMDGRLRGIEADLSEMPDVAQTLAVTACFADGPTVIRGVGNLRVKETDRLEALATELTRIGVKVQVTDDSLTILPQAQMRAAEIETYQDHRMAMSFAIAGLRIDGLVIRNPGCVAKTFPRFFEVWQALGAAGDAEAKAAGQA